MTRIRQISIDLGNELGNLIQSCNTFAEKVSQSKHNQMLLLKRL